VWVLYLKRVELGVKILDLDLNSVEFFPGNDTTDGMLLSIIERNDEELPRHGYAASLYERFYTPRRGAKPGILLKKYRVNSWELEQPKKFFVETDYSFSIKEMKNGILEEHLKKSKERDGIIPIEQFGELRTLRGTLYEFDGIAYFDHLKNESCQVMARIKNVINRGKIRGGNEKNTVAEILPTQLMRIWLNSEIPYTECRTRDFCGFCHLSSYGFEKIEYIKNYLETNGIGSISYVFLPPFGSLSLEVSIDKKLL